jgi:hypothetical protein
MFSSVLWLFLTLYFTPDAETTFFRVITVNYSLAFSAYSISFTIK